MVDWAQSGAAIGDVDGDGLPDLVICGRMAGTRVYRNDGPSGFTDITSYAGVQTPEFDTVPALGDMDGDGDLDLFIGVTSYGEGAKASLNRLYANDGTGAFTEVTPFLDVRGGGLTIFATWFDVDYDGDLDIYTGEFGGTANRLLVNNGDGSFTERAAELGADVGGSSHVVGICETDGDGYAEIFIGSDQAASTMAGFASNVDDTQLRTTGDGKFVDVSAGSGYDFADPAPSTTMGITFGDVNYDGRLDIFKTEINTQLLLINNGWPNGGSWVQAQDFYAVADPMMPDPANPGQFGTAVGWGCAFFHADLDPWVDLLRASGHVGPSSPRGQRNYLYTGGTPQQNFVFTDMTSALGLYDEFDDRGLAVGDIDNDGDIDLVLVPPGDYVRLFENQLLRGGNGWLKVIPETHTSAPGGIGSVVSWTDSSGYPHVMPIGVDGSTASHREAIAHFGLGTETSVNVTVEFPSGIRKVTTGVTPNQTITVVEPKLFELSKKKFFVQGSAPGVASRTGQGPIASPTLAPLVGPDPVDPLVVTVFAHDAAGNVLGKNANVSIRVPGLRPSGPVEHVGRNQFQRSFHPATYPGSFRVETRFNSFRPRVRPTVNFVGEAATARTNLQLDTRAVRARTTDMWTAWVVPRDQNGIAIGAGQNVSLSLSGAPSIPKTVLLDNGDGSYRGTFIAPLEDGIHPIDLEVDSVGVPGVLTLHAGGLPDPASTSIYREDPDPGVALFPYQFKMEILARDSNNVRCGTQGPLSIVVTPDPGSAPAFHAGTLSPVQMETGEFAICLFRGSSEPQGSATGTVEVILNGVTIATELYAF